MFDKVICLSLCYLDCLFNVYTDHSNAVIPEQVSFTDWFVVSTCFKQYDVPYHLSCFSQNQLTNVHERTFAVDELLSKTLKIIFTVDVRLSMNRHLKNICYWQTFVSGHFKIIFATDERLSINIIKNICYY